MGQSMRVALTAFVGDSIVLFGNVSAWPMSELNEYIMSDCYVDRIF
jgi:hypothetical protein